MMKKTMIMTLALLGMVLGSFAVVQPVKAAGPCTEEFIDPYGFMIKVCGECILVTCPGGSPSPICGPTVE
jgi:hypothetical protein